MIENWHEEKLGLIAEKITKGGTPTTYGFTFQKSGINFLKVENIQNGRINLTSITDYISLDAYEFQRKSQLFAGDVLFSIAGTIGVTAVVEQHHLPANTNQALAIIKGTEKCLNRAFLSYQLEYFVQKIKSKARGGAMNNVSLEDLKDFIVKLAPLAEQQRIVAKIEELFSVLDKGIETLKTARDQLKVYRQAVLKYAFEGRLTNPDLPEGELPDGWDESTIRNVCSNIKVGIVIKPTNYYTNNGLGVKAFRSANVREFRVNDTNWVHFSAEANEQNFRTQVFTGDVLIVRSGYPGTSCVVTEKFSGCNAIDILIATPKKELLLPEYLCAFNNSPLGKGMFVENSRGVAQKHLNVGEYSKLKIFIPKITEQRDILDEIESRLSICEKIEESIEQGLQQAEALRQSILKRAFEGKLVPQDTNDEPAHVLLERIRRERTAAQPVKKEKKLKA